MKKSREVRAAALLALGMLAGAGAFAAGGHHAVDDATILDPGKCEQESWFTRKDGDARLLRVAGACRVGPVELAVGTEYERDQGASTTLWGMEVKWARELNESFSVGATVQPVWQAHVSPRYVGFTLLALATWTPREDIALHLNLGRDFLHQGDDDNRGGIAGEWFPAEDWSLVAERYLQSRTHFARAGVRWAGGESWSVDLSRAHRISGAAPSNWTLGLTLKFDRN